MMEEIKKMCLRFEPCGSRVTCNPAPMDTDEDFLALVDESSFNHFHCELLIAGYKIGGSVPTNGGEISKDCKFTSYTLGTTNIIATESDLFFARFMAATSVCKRLNLMDKEDRIALFQAVLYARPDDTYCPSEPIPFMEVV